MWSVSSPNPDPGLLRCFMLPSCPSFLGAAAITNTYFKRAPGSPIQHKFYRGMNKSVVSPHDLGLSVQDLGVQGGDVRSHGLFGRVWWLCGFSLDQVREWSNGIVATTRRNLGSTRH